MKHVEKLAEQTEVTRCYGVLSGTTTTLKGDRVGQPVSPNDPTLTHNHLTCGGMPLFNEVLARHCNFRRPHTHCCQPRCQPEPKNHMFVLLFPQISSISWSSIRSLKEVVLAKASLGRDHHFIRYSDAATLSAARGVMPFPSRTKSNKSKSSWLLQRPTPHL